mgnify:CR=1 FL=1
MSVIAKVWSEINVVVTDINADLIEKWNKGAPFFEEVCWT